MSTPEDHLTAAFSVPYEKCLTYLAQRCQRRAAPEDPLCAKFAACPADLCATVDGTEVRARRRDYYRMVADAVARRPSVVVIEDTDEPAGVGAFWGEVNVAVHLGLGVEGALTNGSMRDLGEVDEGFQILAGSIGPSHAHVRVTELDVPVTVLGLSIEPGALIHADRRVSLHEFIVLTLVRTQLASPGKHVQMRFRTIAEVRTEAALVLSLVAHAGRRPDAEEGVWNLGGAFRAGAREMGLKDLAPVARQSLTPDGIGAALESLRSLAPLAKALFIRGLFATVTFDRSIRSQEAELMRFVGAILDCPLPPLTGARAAELVTAQ